MPAYVWPDDLTPYQQMFYLQPHVGRSESPFTRQMKIYGLSAPRFVCRMTFRGGYDGTEAQGAFGPRLDAFIAKLKGGAARVGIYDFRRTALRGDNAAADLTNEAAAAGATRMRVSGAEPDSLVFVAGDYIGGDGRAHLVTEDAYANPAGLAVVRFEPALNLAVAAGMAVYGNPRSQFRLVSDDAGANDTEIGGLTTYTLEFQEDYWEVAAELASPPFATFDTSSVLPDATTKHKAVRFDDGITELHRQYMDSTGFIEQYVFQRARGYAGVNDGMQLVHWGVFANGRFFSWLVQPEEPGGRTTTEFALRCGYDYDDTGDPTNAGYNEVEDNVNGFGHGRMTCSGCASQLNGTGGSLIEIADWAPGLADMKSGASWVFTSTFKLLLPDDVEGVELQYTQEMNSTSGLRETGLFHALVADVVFQNAPVAMQAFNAGDDPPINRIKLADVSAIVIPVQDAVQKPPFPNPWDATTTSDYYAWHSAEPSIVPTMRAFKKVIQSYPSETLDPYEFCNSIRVGVVDQPDFTKIIAFAHSTTEAFPRFGQALPNDGTTYFFDNFRWTQFFTNGVA